MTSAQYQATASLSGGWGQRFLTLAASFDLAAATA